MQKQPTAGLQNMGFYVFDADVRVSRQLQHLLFSSAIYYSLQRITREVGISLYTQSEEVGIPNLREVNST
jgi:hypothetical protein